jgi:lipopolysaccharide transport system permease protein
MVTKVIVHRAILGWDSHLHTGGLAISVLLAAGLLLLGLWNFRRLERTFADVV